MRESKYTIGLICSRSQINLKVDSFGSAEPSFRESSWMTIIFFWDDSLTDERECFLWMFWCPDNLPYCLKCTHARSGYAVSLKKRNTVKSAFRILTPSDTPWRYTGWNEGEKLTCSAAFVYLTKEKNVYIFFILSPLEGLQNRGRLFGKNDLQRWGVVRSRFLKLESFLFWCSHAKPPPVTKASPRIKPLSC